MDTSNLFDATALAAVVAALVGIAKPFCESLLPWCRDTEGATHDATLQLLTVLLNVGLLLAIAASQGQLSGATWVALALQGLAQAAGSHALYHTVTRSTTPAPSGASEQPAPSPVAAPAAPAPVDLAAIQAAAQTLAPAA